LHLKHYFSKILFWNAIVDKLIKEFTIFQFEKIQHGNENALTIDGNEYGILFKGHQITWNDTVSNDALINLMKWFRKIIITLDKVFYS